MPRKHAAGSSILDKADDAPELTDAFLAAATVRDGDKIVRRGRPKLAAPKRLVSIRFPVRTLERLRATGPGWQGLVVAAVEAELDRVGGKEKCLGQSAEGGNRSVAARRHKT